MFIRFAMAVLLLAVASSTFGQTMVDLRTQSKSVDFSNMSSTRPTAVGISLPATCQVGQMFFNTTAAAGANLFGCTATNTWTVLSGGGSSGGNSGGGGGGTPGATTASQLGDLQITLANNVLTVGSMCSSSTPCSVRTGNLVTKYTFPATIGVTGTASGLVFIYVDNAGNLTAGSTVQLTCNSCNYVPNVTSFPSDSIPLGNWTVTSGSFTAGSGTDYRAFLSIKNLLSGPGVLVSESAGTSTIAIDPSLVSLHVLIAPATSSSTCASGQFSYDANYYYLCVAINTWKRTALSSF